MALVACPECGRQVSTDAAACPNCGKPVSAGAAAGGVVFTPVAAPGPEQTIWEGRPSIALLYGKLLRLAIRCIVLIVIGYIAITTVVPAVASISSEAQTLVEQNTTAIELGIIAVLVLAALPPVFALGQAITRIKNTHYKVTNQRILIESGVLSKSIEEIDLRSVDDTEFHQTFMERIFGIGRVLIISTDKMAPAVALQGIPDARQTRELIRSAAYQVSQRQLFTRAT